MATILSNFHLLTYSIAYNIMKKNIQSMKKAFAESNHRDYEIKVFPNASHFLTVPGSVTEFVPGYLDTMTHWLSRHVGLDNGGEL